MSRTWDFLVAGAGPAGARAAELLARRGADVLLLDPKAPWEKPCGGGLSAAALAHTPELAELRDQWELVHELLVVSPSGACATVPLSRPFAVVSRQALSRWGLERATGAGARFEREAVRSVKRVNGEWRVADRGGRSFRARWLVGADGAASRLRGWLAPDLRPELAPTRVAYPAVGAPPGAAVLLLLPSSKGYLWDFPRADHHSVGVALAPGVFGREVLDRMIEAYGCGGELDATRWSWCGAAVPTRRWYGGRFPHLGSNDYALLGDAAGLADPLTEEGIDYALQSAALAAAAFDQGVGFRRYPRAMRRALRPDTLRWRLTDLLYRPAVVERLVQRAGRWWMEGRVVTALMDALNEHLSLPQLARRIVAAGTASRGSRPWSPAPGRAAPPAAT